VGFGFDSLMDAFDRTQFITVPIAIVFVASLGHSFIRGMIDRYADPESMEFEYLRAMDWLMWTAFVVLVWEIFFLGQTFFKSQVLLTLRKTSPYGVAIGTSIGIITAFSALQWGSYSILRSLNADRAEDSNEIDRQLIAVVRDLSERADIPCPTAYIMSERSPNAFSIGRSPKHASIVVTQGLLDVLSKDELEGVIAHEIGHIKSYDIRVRTAITALFGSTILMSLWIKQSLKGSTLPAIAMPKLRGVSRFLVGLFWVMTLFIVPAITYVVVVMTSRHREYLADASAASLTKNPQALARALVRIEEKNEGSDLLQQNIAHLCIIDPLGRKANGKVGFFGDLLGTHPPTPQRIELLQAMAMSYNQAGRATQTITQA
jgi:heat shock protein HtpX